jgi:hypothetical protein
MKNSVNIFDLSYGGWKNFNFRASYSFKKFSQSSSLRSSLPNQAARIVLKLGLSDCVQANAIYTTHIKSRLVSLILAAFGVFPSARQFTPEISESLKRNTKRLQLELGPCDRS